MSTESLTVRVPDSLARELDSVGESLLIDLIERGLREFKIEQALERYARGGISFGVTIRVSSSRVCAGHGTSLQRRDCG